MTPSPFHFPVRESASLAPLRSNPLAAQLKPMRRMSLVFSSIPSIAERAAMDELRYAWNASGVSFMYFLNWVGGTPSYRLKTLVKVL